MDRQQAFSQARSCSISSTLTQLPSGRKRLIEALTKLLNTLQSVSTNSGALDSRLAEYAFVPISQVLRISPTAPVRALELCLECISVLLRAAWGAALAPELLGQLLILFTFMAKPSSAESGVAASSEELQILALKCISELFTESSRTIRGRQQLTATANIPALGEAVLVILDCLTDSNSNSVKLQAVAAIAALVAAIDDKDALASFLPRIVSSLAKILAPSSTNRPNFRVLERGLDVVSVLFLRLLTDQTTKHLPITGPHDSQEHNKTVRSVAWLQATASQIKIALGNVFKLRTHDKSEVRQALLRLCTTILQECRSSLADCIGMVIETMVILAGHEAQHAIEDDLRMIIVANEELSELLRESLHGWIISLPRLMQSKDDTGRRQVIHKISTTMRLFSENQVLVDELLAENLRDSISAVLNDSKDDKVIMELRHGTGLAQQLVSGKNTSASFAALRLRLKGQDDMMKEFKILLSELAKSNSALAISQQLIDTLDLGHQTSRLAAFWISVNLLRDFMGFNFSIDDFMDLGSSNPQEEQLDNLYAYSLQVLSPQNTTSTPHWHFQALALEVFALQATRYKTDFRAELTETLYPILHCLGSSDSGLRNHATTCLNIVAASCGYESASELVISNVDYIVNAVGLRLSYGDVSPQAPQVLLMMMRLCGPILLPYLDDLVGSIFSALERYHGYPSLVELLFSVLKSMADEGSKAPQLAIISIKQTSNIDKSHEISQSQKILQQLRELERRTREQSEDLEELPRGSFPQQPWEGLNEETFQGPTTSEDLEPSEPPSTTKDHPPPAPRTFDILLKISEITQHYLTSASPSLRTSLLSLLHTTIPALAKHEDSFLPLINTLWPVLLPRLEDPEAYIVANTLDIVTLMCEHAGDFMRSRIESSWDVFKNLRRWTDQRKDTHNNARKKQKTTTCLVELSDIASSTTATSRTSLDLALTQHTGTYIDTPRRMIWNANVRLLCSISRHVEIRDEAFDDVLDILDPMLANKEIRNALDSRNADAVWLRLCKKSQKVTAGGPVEEIQDVEKNWGFVKL
ncbi:hypothetical protein N0V90_006215 [Kalmusia sp. IMI 367209]|nr:hypothetical protein N0V90_006215 [Kalmusia sp. IMI 367209]